MVGPAKHLVGHEDLAHESGILSLSSTRWAWSAPYKVVGPAIAPEVGPASPPIFIRPHFLFFCPDNSTDSTLKTAE